MAECAQPPRTPTAAWYAAPLKAMPLCSLMDWDFALVPDGSGSPWGLAGPTAPTTVSRVLAGIAGVGVPATQGGAGPEGALAFQGAPVAKGAAYLQRG